MARHGVYPRDIVPPRSEYYVSGRFGRMFGKLPSFSSDNPKVRSDLLKLGAIDGPMDAQEPPGLSPVELLDPANSGPNVNNPRMTAGMTFLGQFIDHDMTFDPTSSLERQADPEQISNFRTPSLGLDNVYGAGPDGSPHLYDWSASGRGIKFLLEPTGTANRNDLPRNSQGTALIGDPRNDENLIISQLQVAFLSFHNKVVDYVEGELGLVGPGPIFAEAQRIVRWHYQWIVLHEFLVATVGEEVVKSVLQDGRKFYKWRNDPFIPVEFSVAAYRFGHSQVRPSYRANFDGDGGQPFIAMIFRDTASPANDPDDLSGGKRAPRRFVDWRTFFDFDDEVRPNKKIDIKLSSALFKLPPSVVANPDPLTNPVSLAQRNLLRHLTFSLPSGQRVAKAMKLPPLTESELDVLRPFDLENNTPLWFYVLLEAEQRANGETLGPVGGRIVAEVFIGLLQGDRSSFLSQEADWQPFLTTVDDERRGKDFTMVDMLRFAGVA